MSDLKAWYQTQSGSSKTLIFVASLMLIVFVGLEWIFDPWKQKLNALRSQVDEKVTIIAWMEQQVEQNRLLIKAGKIDNEDGVNAKRPNSSGSLITQIEQSAKKIQIYSSIERISPDKAGRVKVWMNNGDFSLLLKWVESLKKNGIDIIDLRANQLEVNSSVSITVTFQSS